MSHIDFGWLGEFVNNSSHHPVPVPTIVLSSILRARDKQKNFTSSGVLSPLSFPFRPGTQIAKKQTWLCRHESDHGLCRCHEHIHVTAPQTKYQSGQTRESEPDVG